MDAYLAVCAIYRDEAPYLAEWIEFHRLVGIERFLLYDNLSVDEHAEVLAPYEREGIVQVERWPQTPGQLPAYGHCLARHREAARWIAFIDVDEFLFSPTLEPLPALLREYERWPGVRVNQAAFGASGHRAKPTGLVTESYLWRATDDAQINHFTKSIVDPRRATRARNPHAFDFQEGEAVNERHEPVATERITARSRYVTFSRFRVNHYRTKSWAEWVQRQARGKAANTDALGRFRLRGGEHRPPDAFEQAEAERHCQVYDDTVLGYLPPLRAALGATRA